MPKGILRDRLRSDLYQGDTGRATGVLVRDDGGIGLHPSPYSISVLRGDGSTERLAYVLGDEAQLSRHVGKRVQVEGTCWWIAGASATLSPTSIRPIP